VTEAEPLLYNNNGNGGRITSYSLDTPLISEITSIDFDLRNYLQDWKATDNALTAATTTDAIEVAVKSAQKSMSAADLLFNDMSKLLNAQSVYATPTFITTLGAWQATIARHIPTRPTADILVR